MKYYIFRVKDNLGQEYYVLNNQYIGYLGCDCNYLRSTFEWSAAEKSKERKLVHQYQLYAESDYIADGGEQNAALHKINCSHERFDKRNIELITREHHVFIRSKNKSWYKLYYPSKNSSACYLREIRGTKTIK